MNQIKQFLSVAILLGIALSCNKDHKKAKRSNKISDTEEKMIVATVTDSISKNQQSVIEPIHEKLHASLSKDVFLRFERTACFGKCPSYVLVIQKDGKASYEGIEWVVNKGKFNAIIEAEVLKRIREKAEEIGFFSMADSYDNKYVTDLPSVITTLKTRNGFKTIVNRYQGPETLRAFERFIDEQLKKVIWQPKQNDEQR